MKRSQQLRGEESSGMKVIVEGEPGEIAALVLELQKRHGVNKVLVDVDGKMITRSAIEAICDMHEDTE